MSVWDRRILVFGLVLGAGSGIACVARTALAATAVPAGNAAAASDASPVRPGGSAAAAARPEQAASAPPRLSPSIRIPAANTGFSGPASSAIPLGSTLRTGGVRTFHDRSYKVSFDYPENWQFTERDHEISTFRLDARSADRKAQLRAVTAIPENPYPASTFTGAYVYLSVTPHSNQHKCAAQATAPNSSKKAVSQIAGLNFVHGHDEQKQICTVERDEIYTTYRKGACYRFDLAMNNFCGGEVSGVKDVTKQELDTVLTRMESIMETVRFDQK